MRAFAWLAAGLAILFGAIAPSPVLGQSGLDRLATVHITSTCKDPQTGSLPDQQGTGFIIDKRGYVLTAAHVISCERNWLREKISARVGSPKNPEWHLIPLRTDEQIDVAVLKFLGDPPESPALKMCALRVPPPEMRFDAAGFPLGEAYRSVDGRVGTTEGGLWAVASPFVGGMSGGPVAHNGFVVGLVKGGLVKEKIAPVTAASFITPIYRARTMIEDETGLRLPECPTTQQAEAERIALQQEQERKRVEAEAAKKKAAEQVARQDPALSMKPGSGESFRDCAECPEMLVLPAGEFIMGSNEYHAWQPPHRVTIRRPFAVGKFEVTFAEWDACVTSGGCKHKPADEGWGRDKRPVFNVTWDDAQEYAAWLSRKTGKRYRLLSEAEWEYAARAGTSTRYAFGDEIKKTDAQYSEGTEQSAGKTAQAGSFPANRFGLHDMYGNVSEWCADNWHPNYQGAPDDGSVWSGGNASLRILRGGAWANLPELLRSAVRIYGPPIHRSSHVGLRVARTL